MSGHVTERTTIRQLRQARGWTQTDLAGRLQIAPSTVANWEQRRAWPQPATLLRLADLFGVSVEAIAFGPAEPPGTRIGDPV